VSTVLRGRGIVKGRASGPALVAREAVSFLGDVDIRSGAIVGDLPSVRNANVRGRVLVMPYTRGSAGAWRFLYQLFKHDNHPVALVVGTLPDPSVVQGAILAGIPIVCETDRDPVAAIPDGSMVMVDADAGNVTIG
jgi:predicted aconitase with swiveling domain